MYFKRERESERDKPKFNTICIVVATTIIRVKKF